MRDWREGRSDLLAAGLWFSAMLLPRHWLFCSALAIALAAAPAAFAVPPPKRTDPALQMRVQAALPRQPQLLQQALHALAPQRPGVRDLYFVGFAGYGDQDVFRKEVERVRAQFDQEFGTRGHSLVLVNSPATLDRYPLATLQNLKTVLAELGKQFDPQEDVLFLFMTSHGDRRTGLALRLNGRRLGDIVPRQLADVLASAGIKNRVVLISSCFSGQFVTPLANDDSLVITASAANRSSFGCATDAEWTYFGKSYFVDALPEQKKFIPAFYDAQNIVAVREVGDQVPPSQPQISIGSRIERVLQELGY
ncbi:MAG TPA: C13 family peptidase [Xanthobacteraceae bacterium]|nr:C13 family peptidase [Xanthobacteraceae bacterium]